MKAKGKGPGEFISTTERQLNAEFPETIHFEFDTQDIGEDKVAAEVAAMWIGAYLPLTKAGAMMSSPGGALASGSTTVPDDRGNAAAEKKVGVGDGEGIISDEHFLRLLSDKGVLPDYIVGDDRVAIMDYEVYVRKEGPVACYTWKDGALTMKQLPPIVLPKPVGDVPDAKREIDYKEYQEKLKRNIRGKPIPEGEVKRGASVTEAAIKTEQELWRGIHALSQHASTEEESADEEIISEE